MSDMLGQFLERTAVNARKLPAIFSGQYISVRRETHSWCRHYRDKPLMSLHNCFTRGPVSPDSAVEPTR